MILGLLPSIRGGLGELAKTGQHSRLIDGYLRPYARAFEEVRYFSYLNESLLDYTDDTELAAKVRLFPGDGWHPWLYAFVMPFRYRRQLSGCAVLRVFQVTGVIPAVLAKRLFGVPFVTTYGFWYSTLAHSPASRWLRRWVERVGLAMADGVIVTTPELGAHVAAKAGAAKVHLIPNGVDTRRFAPSPLSSPPRGRGMGEGGPARKILYVGRLSPEKNLGTLISAVGQLLGRLPLRLTFIGDGPAREALEARARELRVPVDFLPFVDHRRLPDFFREADAFVLPSFTEGHPKVLLEAMSCGVPCVASARGGNLDIVADGKTGLLFDPENAGELAECLERVLTNDDLARSLATEARAAIVERYDLRALVGREIDLLKRVARGGLCD